MTARIIAAAGLVLVWLLLCLHAWRAARRRQAAQAPAPATAGDALTVVAYASQTGCAEDLARRTQESLQAAGVPACVLPLARIDDALLARPGRMLFIASTTGEGDAPDPAMAFASRVMDDEARAAAPGTELSRLEYAVLALGDREYANFCRFGRLLDEWLRHRGARALFDRVEVDDGDDGALRHWQRQLGLLAGGVDLPDWEAPRYDQWTLAERRELNPGSPGDPCFHIVLRPPGAMPEWRAGDIAEIGPRRSADDPELLPHREYSIASVPQAGAVHLLVRRMRRPDGELGAGSGWLTARAQPGDAIALRIRSNRNFHPPEPGRGLILVGNGTGLAGLRAHLQAREHAGDHENWLLFGERTGAHDFHYREEIEAWLRKGHLRRLDLAFSRDQGERVYVQHKLMAAADDVREWIGRGAAVYVCGSQAGMAPGVHQALETILGPAQLESLAATGRYRRDVY